MITLVEVTTPRVTTAPLPITDGKPSTDLIQIRNIDGLGPVVADVNTSQYAGIDGEFFIGSNIGKRNIVLTIGLHPDWGTYTYEQLRAILYQYFMPKNNVTLTFTSTHMETVAIDGVVESMEPNIFSQSPEVQVSVICPTPEFVAVAPTIVPGVSETIAHGAFTIINYRGTLPTGFTLDVAPTMGVDDYSGQLRVELQNPITQLFLVDVVIDGTKYVELSTNRGDKYIRELLLVDNSPTNILGNVTPGSIWLGLLQGANKFRVITDPEGYTWSLKYFAKYGGI